MGAIEISGRAIGQTLEKNYFEAGTIFATHLSSVIGSIGTGNYFEAGDIVCDSCISG